jgi:AraC-like DNA-binding protein
MVETQSGHRDPPTAHFRLELAVSPGNAHEYDLWRFGMSPLFVMDALDPSARSTFQVAATSYQFADVAVCHGSASATTFKRTAQTIARSGLDNICLVVHLSGGCVLDIEGRSTDVGAGDIFLIDLSRRCVISAPDYTSLSIVLPRAALAQFLPDLDNLHGLVLPKASPFNTMLVNHLQTLFAEIPSLGARDVRASARGTASLIAALVGASANGREATTQAASVASLQALRRMIEANLADPGLGPEFLCQQLAMSRATLYRLFEPLGGVRRYIQQRRLTRAYQTITDPARGGERVGTIAVRLGFTNDSVFSRAFREAYGMSPTDLRENLGRGDALGFDCSKDSHFMIMNRWLLGMDVAGR